jgi:NAD(P)-dependent dehydrogenase (short-subunit alcohol dehydrogenase family)
MNVFNPKLFDGKHVFITGGSSGINLRIAERFAECGAKVSIVARNAEKLAAAEQQLAKRGPAKGYAADVRDFPALSQAFEVAHKEFGGIDVLVCGAAGNFPAPAAMLSPNGFRAVLEIDTLGTFHACKAAFDHLTKPGGVILSISAPQASVPYPMQAHVCAAKAGVDMITRTLAYEWGGLGLRVNSISPGPIDDTEGMTRLAPDAAAREKVSKLVPLQRFGTKDDVANLALFLSSDAASYCTGGVYSVDGGMQLLGGGMMTAMMS